jgi:hypothetical protein
MTSEFPDEVDQRRWDEAYRRADAIGDFLRQRSAGSTAEGPIPCSDATAVNLRISAK